MKVRCWDKVKGRMVTYEGSQYDIEKMKRQQTISEVREVYGGKKGEEPKPE